jgi:hypothetical protein
MNNLYATALMYAIAVWLINCIIKNTVALSGNTIITKFSSGTFFIATTNYAALFKQLYQHNNKLVSKFFRKNK